jgi:adenylyltransferase/sulfurtransferase
MYFDQNIRYSRNIALPQIGKSGQDKLLASKVLVIGAGGLGSPVLLYLAAAGVGNIGIVDGDKVDISNLQRQIIHNSDNVGQNKTESAWESLHDLNRDINIKCYHNNLSEDNIDIIDDYEIVADCSDNFATRLLISDYCYHHKKILVSAAVIGFDGQLSTYKPFLEDGSPCYRCIYPEAGSDEINCSSSGVLGSVVGVMGSLQATEIIKEILSVGESISGQLLRFNGLNNSYKKVKIKSDPECKCCSKS